MTAPDANGPVKAGRPPLGTDPLSRTARWTAASRARESERTGRLFTDPLAARLCGREGFELVDRARALLGEQSYLPVRVRWFDDAIGRAVRGRARQVVLLAAGLDTRAFRLSWPPGTTVYELDRPELHAWKHTVLDRASAAATCPRHTVDIDLTREWTMSLIDAGHDPNRPTVWVAEGLLFYLAEADVRRVLTDAAGVCGAGSILLADLVNTTYDRVPALRSMVELFAEMGAPWRFGTDDPGGLLAECGWTCAEVVVVGDEAANYGRLPYPHLDEGVPRGFLVTGVRG